MNDTDSQSALRQWRNHMGQPLRLGALAGVAAILTIMAPFGTGDLMTAFPRLGYWLVLVLATYALGFTANLIAERIFPENLAFRIILAGSLTAIAAFAVVYALNILSFDYWASGTDLFNQATRVFLISFIIATIFQFVYSPDVSKAVEKPRILERLPFEKRGLLISMSAEDHYTRIRTTKGEEMILIRLSDAIAETGEVSGLQVHRSHWISLDKVKGAKRKGDGAIVSMKAGPDIPVSRSNMDIVRKAGLLPE